MLFWHHCILFVVVLIRIIYLFVIFV